MKEVTVNTGDLLSKVKDNREKHKAIVAEANEGYQEKLVETLAGMLSRAKAGERVNLYISLPEPASHLEDYDTAIEMLEMCTTASVTISHQEFSNLVRDNWEWKRDFVASNMHYLKTHIAHH